MQEFSTDKETIDSLIQQVITLEEQMDILSNENRVLKECIKGEGETVITEILKSLHTKIDESTEQILLSIKKQIITPSVTTTSLPNTLSELSSLSSYLSQEVSYIKMLLSETEKELSQLFSSLSSLSFQLQEKDQQIKLYALVNQKLTAIKDEYLRIRHQQ